MILVGTVSRYVGDQENSSDRISSMLEIIQTSQKDCSIKMEKYANLIICVHIISFIFSISLNKNMK